MTESQEENLSFETSLARLEEIVHDLEDGQIGLEESVARYEVGVSLIKRCQAKLKQTEQRILILTGADEEGLPALTPFPSATSSEEPKPDPRRPRKKAMDADSGV